jgi:crotonobetaine/carnitine-CoA ligase
MVSAVARTAGTLSSAGVSAGDRVAIMTTNRVETLELFLGCAWLGAVAVPFNNAMSGPQLEYALTHSGSKLLVAEAGFLKPLASVSPPGTLELVWTLDGAPPAQRRGYTIDSWPGGSDAVAPAELHPGTTAALVYTSGTTGLPKGVCCPHAQFFWGAVAMNEVLGIGEEDVLYSCLPLFHTNALGTFFKTLLGGAACAYGTRFSASGFWTELVDTEATVTFLLGAMVSILCSRAPTPAEREHHVRVALAPATPASLIASFLDRTGIRLVDAYGSTETGGTISAPPGQQKPGYMGRVLRDFEARVVDENDVELPDGTLGELVLRNHQPYSFATGYFRMPDLTVKTRRNLWLHTGDRVIRDSDGWFRFHDRSADVIRRRGENISSYEVEQALISHEDISVAAVYAVPSPWGEDDVAAAVVVRAGVSLTGPELIAHCEARLPYFAIPRYLDFVESVPMMENGKVRREELKARGITDSMWDRERHVGDGGRNTRHSGRTADS